MRQIARDDKENRYVEGIDKSRIKGGKECPQIMKKIPSTFIQSIHIFRSLVIVRLAF